VPSGLAAERDVADDTAAQYESRPTIGSSYSCASSCATIRHGFSFAYPKKSIGSAGINLTPWKSGSNVQIGRYARVMGAGSIVFDNYHIEKPRHASL
jgi:hypothetical protein